MFLRKSYLAAVVVVMAAAALLAQEQPRREPDVVFVPTTDEAVKAMLELAGVTKNDIVYDLGCGDGRIVVAAAKLGARAVGIDIDPRRISEARSFAKSANVEDLVRFEENDLFEADFHEATVVTLFLLPDLNLKLKPRLLQQLKPGTRVVSNTFNMGDWKPDKEMAVQGSSQTYLSKNLFLWIIPQKK
jgi:SAM-dependent methyltransferase